MDDQAAINQWSNEKAISVPETCDSFPETISLPQVRERILAEATRLFAKKGFNGVSVREIVEAAGVAKPALYYYFANKDKLFRQIVLATLDDFQEQLRAAVESAMPLRDQMIRITRLHIDFARANADPTRITYGLYFSSERNILDFDLDEYFTTNIRLIGGVIQRAMANGEVDAGDPWLMALGYVGILNIFIMGMLYNPAAFSSEGLAEFIVEYALKGMAAKPAR